MNADINLTVTVEACGKDVHCLLHALGALLIDWQMQKFL